MVSAKQKGSNVENEIKALLESKEWKVIKSPRTMKCIGPGRFISMDNDYFNLFDLIAKNKLGKTLWIQAKSTASGVSSAKQGIEDFETYLGEDEKSQIWLKVSRKGFIVYNYDIGKWNKSYLKLDGSYSKEFTLDGEEK